MHPQGLHLQQQDIGHKIGKVAFLASQLTARSVTLSQRCSHPPATALPTGCNAICCILKARIFIRLVGMFIPFIACLCSFRTIVIVFHLQPALWFHVPSNWQILVVLRCMFLSTLLCCYSTSIECLTPNLFLFSRLWGFCIFLQHQPLELLWVLRDIFCKFFSEMPWRSRTPAPHYFKNRMSSKC